MSSSQTFLKAKYIIFFQHLAITRVYFYLELGNEETFLWFFCDISKRNLFVPSSDVAAGVECVLFWSSIAFKLTFMQWSHFFLFGIVSWYSNLGENWNAVQQKWMYCILWSSRVMNQASNQFPHQLYLRRQFSVGFLTIDEELKEKEPILLNHQYGTV